MRDPDVAIEGPSADARKSSVNAGALGGAFYVPEPGTRIGRLQVLESLGAGASGVVLAAYDPDLDRKIALKLLHPRPRHSDDERVAEQRLLREARAMARLTHPNVVTIHEIGTIGDRVFIAMEYAEGGTLRDWLREKERSWRQILDAFLQAGRGLAAAHQAQLVHRDFKPENVVIGADGRIRVSDFGLVSTRSKDLKQDAIASMAGNDFFHSLTHEDMAIGTPLYMAPEQHGLEKVDERADQFAFCVALYEALFGEPPFAGESYWELLSNVCSGRMRRPPKSPVPAHVKSAIARGLQVRPEDRYPSMDALLDDLAPVRATTWRAALLTIAAVVIAAGGTTLFLASHAGDDNRCGNARSRVAEVWGWPTRVAIQSAFAATNRTHAETTWRAVSRRLDDYAERWVQASTEACQANARGEQSDEALDLRMSCLSNTLSEMEALTQALASTTGNEVVDNAIEAVGTLPHIEACSDLARLRRKGDGVQKDGLLRLVALANLKFAAASVALHPGGTQHTESIIQWVLDSLEDPQSRARALLLRTQFQVGKGEYSEAEASLREALQASSAAQDDYLAAQSAIGLLTVLSISEVAAPDAQTVAEFAQAAVTRSGAPPYLRGALLEGLGRFHFKQGDYDRALEHLERAVRLLEEAEDLNLFHTIRVMAAIARTTGDLERALEANERALAAVTEDFGPDHPMQIGPLVGLGNTKSELGEPEEAAEYYRKALDIALEVRGPESLTVSDIRLNLANMALHTAKFERARELYRQALEGYERKLGPSDGRIARTLNGLAGALDSLGKTERAETYLRRALEIWTQVYGPDHPETALARFNLAVRLRRSGDATGARRLFEQVLSSWKKAYGPDHINTARALTGLGAAMLDEGKAPAKTRSLLHRALEISEEKEVRPELLADARFAAARSLWTRDRTEAERLVGLARAGYLDAGPIARESLAELGAFLKAHGRPPE